MTGARISIVSSLLLLVLVGTGAAQSSMNPPSRSSDTTEEASDNDPQFVMTKSPAAAVAWGIIPTGGQVYTEQYWKVPLFMVPIGALVGFAVHSNTMAARWNDSLDAVSKDSDDYDHFLSSRESNRSQRDLFIAIGAGVYLLSIIDAYVGAHLYDFDVSDSLAFEIAPDFRRGGASIGVKARF